MSRPAARATDPMVHGGIIALGCPTVLIGGLPASRVGDLHVCPMMTPAGPVPVPHFGGLITMGSGGVLIGGQPAARMGDMAFCIGGPPNVIANGCPTVLIGESVAGAGGGGGGAGMGGASGSPAGPATISAGIAMIAGGPGGESGAGAGGATDQGEEEETEEGHWIKFQFVDNADNSISGVYYEFTTPDGSIREGRLDADGTVSWRGPDPGEGKVKLMSVTNARWSTNKARVEEKVELTADVEGYDPGTPARFEIFGRDVNGADKLIDTIETATQADKVETEWEYIPAQAESSEPGTASEPGKYSYPEYYFDVIVEQSKARSGLLELMDSMEIEVIDEEDNPIPDIDYVLYLSSGEVRKGQLDGNGYKKEDNVPPTAGSIRFPKLPCFEDVE